MIMPHIDNPGLTAILSTTKNSVGLAGEVAIARAFESNGYVVDIAHYRGDLHVIDPAGEVFRVEVKTARKGPKGRWTFNLWKAHSQDHTHSDFVVLLCLAKTGHGYPFVVPIEAIRDKHHATICSWPLTYSGWLAQYRQSMRKLRLPEIGALE